MSTVMISCARSTVLDQFLALQRELMGRCTWEVGLLPRPVTPMVDRFRVGVQRWRDAGVDYLPDAVGRAADLAELVELSRNRPSQHGASAIVAALRAAEPDLRPGLAMLEPFCVRAERSLEKLTLGRVAEHLQPALGGSQPPVLPLYLVPLAPYPPALGFLTDGDQPTAAYLDCHRYVGSTLIEAVMTLLGWAMLRMSTGPESLSAQVATLVPGSGPYHRRLRAVLMKVLVEMTAGHLVRRVDPSHRPCVDVLGTAWRFPRLYGVACRHWKRYLDGSMDRHQAMAGIAEEVSGYSPRWYVDHVDAAALAADFYLLEWLASAGDTGARARLAEWSPELARDLASQLDVIVGTELGHYERVRPGALPARLSGFLRKVTHGDSRVAWWRFRVAASEATALDLAVEAFAGPGAEYGGEAWAPIAAMLRRYVAGELPERVFIDQCFTLQHNNGSLFDKYYLVDDMKTVLDAQAAGDLETLAAHASAEVRTRLAHHVRQRYAGHDARWLGLSVGESRSGLPAADEGLVESPRLTVRSALPGEAGSGSAQDPAAVRAGQVGDLVDPVRVRIWRPRRPPPPHLRRFRQAQATLHTSLGEVRLTLRPALAPYTVDNFIALAEGSRAWTDPETGVERHDPFYHGTSFHRRVPGFLVQGGDRTGTGDGGPGYRIPDEVRPEMVFDRPYLVAMSNHGPDGTGSQFFVTLASARHLDGAYTQMGEVRHEPSRKLLAEIAGYPEPVLVHRVTIEATPADQDSRYSKSS
jgi:cyclophilin family peptidyl-prolyl cis-trans isomerase